jgi:hypothetical protein
MTDFSEVEREAIAVQLVRVADGLANIRWAWDELEAVVPLRGRDETRPSLEHYRRHDEIDLLLPI